MPVTGSYSSTGTSSSTSVFHDVPFVAVIKGKQITEREYSSTSSCISTSSVIDNHLTESNSSTRTSSSTSVFHLPFVAVIKGKQITKHKYLSTSSCASTSSVIDNQLGVSRPNRTLHRKTGAKQKTGAKPKIGAKKNTSATQKRVRFTLPDSQPKGAGLQLSSGLHLSQVGSQVEHNSRSPSIKPMQGQQQPVPQLVGANRQTNTVATDKEAGASPEPHLRFGTETATKLTERVFWFRTWPRKCLKGLEEETIKALGPCFRAASKGSRNDLSAITFALYAQSGKVRKIAARLLIRLYTQRPRAVGKALLHEVLRTDGDIRARLGMKDDGQRKKDLPGATVLYILASYINQYKSEKGTIPERISPPYYEEVARDDVFRVCLEVLPRREGGKNLMRCLKPTLDAQQRSDLLHRDRYIKPEELNCDRDIVVRLSGPKFSFRRLGEWIRRTCKRQIRGFSLEKSDYVVRNSDALVRRGGVIRMSSNDLENSREQIRFVTNQHRLEYLSRPKEQLTTIYDIYIPRKGGGEYKQLILSRDRAVIVDMDPPHPNILQKRNALFVEEIRKGVEKGGIKDILSRHYYTPGTEYLGFITRCIAKDVKKPGEWQEEDLHARVDIPKKGATASRNFDDGVWGVHLRNYLRDHEDFRSGKKPIEDIIHECVKKFTRQLPDDQRRQMHQLRLQRINAVERYGGRT